MNYHFPLSSSTETGQDRWSRVQGRLRSSVGNDAYSCWFISLHLESIRNQSLHLTVPTPFLKSWVQNHYADCLLTCCKAEMPEVQRIHLTVRTPRRRAAPPVKQAPVSVKTVKPVAPQVPKPQVTVIMPVPANHDILDTEPIRPAEPKRITIDDIQRVVARHYDVSRADMLRPRGIAKILRPRHIAMYLAKTLTLQSLADIGQRFGGRDHTTVLSAVRKIEALVARNTARSAEVELLKRQLQT